MNELWSQTATSLSELIGKGQITAVEAVESALERMEQVNGELNAVVDSCAEEAILQAKEIDKQLSKGHQPSPLAGVPVTVKVNIDQENHATTNGLQLQKDLIATSDSPVVQNLKAAGAIIIGRTNTPAFSMRWFTNNSLHGHTLNPVNKELTPGGSSGGAASAVASGIGAIAHGTDIAGSIRYPAFACGVHGLRPSLGRVPAYNESSPDRFVGGQLMAVSGPLARSINDVRMAFKAMAGCGIPGASIHGARDPWYCPMPFELPAVRKRAAMALNPDGMDVDPVLVSAMQEAAAKMRAAGWEVIETECPSFSEAQSLNLSLWMAEMEGAAGNVAKEGNKEAIFVYDQLVKLAQVHAGSEPKPQGLAQLLQARAALTRKWQLFMEEYPLLICPPSGEVAFPDQLDVLSEEAFQRVCKAQLTQIGLPLMGIPGLCVTTGFVDAEETQARVTPAVASGRVPIGVQLIGSRYREDVLLDAGNLLECEVMPAMT